MYKTNSAAALLSLCFVCSSSAADQTIQLGDGDVAVIDQHGKITVHSASTIKDINTNHETDVTDNGESVKAANLIVMKTPDKGVYIVTKDVFVKEKTRAVRWQILFSTDNVPWRPPQFGGLSHSSNRVTYLHGSSELLR